MSDNKDIAEALSGALSVVDPPVRSIAYLSDTFTPPVALVAVDEVDFHAAFGNQAVTKFKLFLILNRASDRTALEKMEAFMNNAGSASIRAALEADQSLGGISAGVKVIKAGPPAAITVNTNPYVGCPFDVEVTHGD